MTDQRAWWELEAREAVRDTVAAYAVAGDRFRLDELAACFTPDGVLEIKGREPAVGREAIVTLLSTPTNRPTVAEGERFYVRHHVSNVRIETLTATEAHSTAYFLVLTPIGLDHWGRYRDVLVPHEGRWRFRHRFVAVDGRAPDARFTGPAA